MVISRMLLILGAGMTTADCAGDGVKSGHASVIWLSTSKTCQAGMPLQTAIRMTLDEGWHTYWVNPGDGGMKTRFEWNLPAGWKAGDVQYPVPERFLTSGLAGLGHEGIVLFPVTITPPADFNGAAELKVSVSWLACSDAACVPGDAELALAVSAGPLSATADDAVVREALRKVPQAASGGVSLGVIEEPARLVLTIEVPPGKRLDLADREVFPATPQVLASSAAIRFVPDGTKWTARVAKSEYAKTPIAQLTLVFAGKGEDAPFQITWWTR